MKVDANLFPKIILEERLSDGSDTPNPAADHRALFLGEDGLLHLRDSAGGVTDIGGAGAGAFTEYCSVFGTAVSQANGAETAVACASENYDPAGMHDLATNNSRVTIATTGKYHIDAQLTFAPNSTGQRAIELRLSGGALFDQFVDAVASPFTTKPAVSGDAGLAAGDYLEVYAYQNSGGALNATVTFFNVRRFA